MSVRALTVAPGIAGSARLELIDDVEPGAGIELETVMVGVCGTDSEIVAGTYGTAPPGADRLVLGHEAVARVTDPRRAKGFAAGDLVVPIVRRPDPVPCGACASSNSANEAGTSTDLRGAAVLGTRLAFDSCS